MEMGDRAHPKSLPVNYTKLGFMANVGLPLHLCCLGHPWFFTTPQKPLYSLLGRHFGILRADFTLAASVDPEDRKKQLLQEVRLSMQTPTQSLVPHSHLGSW